MKTVILTLLLGCVMSLQAFSADEPLIPEPLNTLLPKIKSGMTVSQVESVLSPSYTNLTTRGAVSPSYQKGYVYYRLDDRFTLSVGFLNLANGRNITPVVNLNMLFYVSDAETGRRFGILLGRSGSSSQ